MNKGGKFLKKLWKSRSRKQNTVRTIEIHNTQSQIKLLVTFGKLKKKEAREDLLFTDL